MTLKLAQFCDDPQKISTKSSYPPKIFIFLKTPKKYWNSELWTPKNRLSLRMCENIRVPTLGIDYFKFKDLSHGSVSFNYCRFYSWSTGPFLLPGLPDRFLCRVCRTVSSAGSAKSIHLPDRFICRIRLTRFVWQTNIHTDRQTEKSF